MPKRGRTEAERLSSTPGSSTNRFTSTSVDTSDADSEIAPQESPPAAKPQPVETRLFASGALAEYLPKLFLIEKGAHAGYYGCRLCHPGGRCDETKRHGRGLASVFSATTISNVSTIRRHFAKYHPLGDDGIPQRKATASQATLDRYFSPGRQTSVVKDLVMMVCANDLSFNFVEEPRAHRLLAPYFPKPSFGRKDMKDAVVSLYEEVRTQLFSALSGKLVLLCIDGGTIYRKTYLNVTVACENCSYFYTSFPAQRLTSEWISEQLKTVIRELRNNGVVVAGICADNASNMQKAATLLQADPFDSSDEECDPLGAEDEEKPVQFDFTYDEANEAGHFFFNVRCWAHTLQLVLHDAQSAAKRQTRSNTLQENDWLAMVDSLSETLQRATETQPHMQTRMASAKIAAAKLQTGLRIQYEVTPGVSVKAIVYEKIGPYSWRVRTIEPASEVTSVFLPITDHIGWTFVDSVDEPSQ